MPHTPGQIDIAKARAATGSQMIGQMYALLKELEFCQQDFVGNAVCPICRMYSADAHPSGGHESDCRLAAVLKAVEGE